jgi:hypothetical protein
MTLERMLTTYANIVYEARLDSAALARLLRCEDVFAVADFLTGSRTERFVLAKVFAKIRAEFSTALSVDSQSQLMRQLREVLMARLHEAMVDEATAEERKRATVCLLPAPLHFGRTQTQQAVQRRTFFDRIEAAVKTDPDGWLPILLLASGSHGQWYNHVNRKFNYHSRLNFIIGCDVPERRTIALVENLPFIMLATVPFARASTLLSIGAPDLYLLYRRPG